MSDHVYKLLELTGSSSVGIEDAVQKAIAKAHETVRKMQWFEVTETRGHIVEGTTSVAHLREDLGALECHPSSDLLSRLDALFDPAAVTGERYSAGSQAEVDTERF